jgi:glycerol uptake facilitator protein
MSPYLAEFFGTMILIVLGDGVVAGVVLKGTKSENAGWLTIVIGWGLAVALAVYAVGSISGAHLNPAVTIALAWSGNFEWSQVPGYCLAQMLGAFAGGVLVWLHYLPHWGKTDSAALKLGVFCNAPAVRTTGPNFLSEVIATAVLVLALMFIGANRFADGLNPLVIGGLVASIGLSLGGTTGFAINPARDLGPRIAHFILPIPGKGSSDWGYSWIPVIGPIVGGVLGAFVYRLFFL